MNRYDSYKDSGVDWIGEIPSHWFFVGTNKVYNDLGTGTTPTSDNTEYYSDNGYHWITTTDLNEGIMYDTLSKITDKSVEDYPNLRLYPSGSIYISMYGGRIGKLGVSTFDSYCNQSVCVLPKNDEIIVKFYYYWFLGFQEFVKGMGRGGGQPNINKDMIKSFPTVKIPLPEQQQIVTFLDTKTSLIDFLIEKTQRKIELLKEKRTSLINEVVTKGLNPNVEMKDSGVEWIGEIPSHWIKTKVKYISDVVRGSILRPVDEPLYFDENGEWTYLNISDVSKVEKFLNYGKLRLSELGSTKSRRVEPNNLIITGSGTVGKVFINTIPVCVHDGFIPLLNLKVNINFMFYYLINPNLYVGIGKTNSQKNIYLDEVKEMDISIPSDTEQHQIVSFLDEQTNLIDNTISVEEKRIELLKEYRQSLISEVVTGKLKVTTDE